MDVRPVREGIKRMDTQHVPYGGKRVGTGVKRAGDVRWVDRDLSKKSRVGTSDTIYVAGEGTELGKSTSGLNIPEIDSVSRSCFYGILD